MEGMALGVCEILKYLIIHWKCEATISKGALLEGQLVISIEALNSKHQPNSLHCIASITSVGSIYGGLVLKKFLKEIQSILPRFSAKPTCTSEERNCFQDTSRVPPFQIIFEVDEKLRTLKESCLVIKHFLHKIVIVHHKIKFNFSVKVNGVLSTEIFGIENEPTLNLSNGIVLVTDNQHYVRRSTLQMSVQSLKDSMALKNECVALVPVSVPSEEQPSNTVFKDTSYFIDWKKYHLYMVPNLDLSLDKDLVLPDVSYHVEPSEETQSQKMDPQGPTLLLFLFMDFHSRFPVQKMEIWGVHTLLTAHLSAILMKSRSVVQDSVQTTVDQVLQQYYQATKAQQKLQASLSVAVSSIMSVVTGSTCSSFRRACLQGLQAADTQEFGTKLHKIFHDITQHRFLPHCSCDKEQVTQENKDSAQSTEDTLKNSSLQLPEETSGPAENKRLKKGGLHLGVKERSSAGHPGPPQPTAAHGRASAPGTASLGGGLQDALWLQEVSNLSEWLSPGPGR